MSYSVGVVKKEKYVVKLNKSDAIKYFLMF